MILTEKAIVSRKCRETFSIDIYWGKPHKGKKNQTFTFFITNPSIDDLHTDYSKTGEQILSTWLPSKVLEKLIILRGNPSCALLLISLPLHLWLSPLCSHPWYRYNQELCQPKIMTIYFHSCLFALSLQ